MNVADMVTVAPAFAEGVTVNFVSTGATFVTVIVLDDVPYVPAEP